MRRRIRKPQRQLRVCSGALKERASDPQEAWKLTPQEPTEAAAQNWWELSKQEKVERRMPVAKNSPGSHSPDAASPQLSLPLAV